MTLTLRLERTLVAASMAIAVSLGFSAPALAGGPPGYEPAYVGGITVTINAIEVKQNAGVIAHATADFYETVYPIGWQALGIAAPQCNPCDHEGNGIDFTDFHDHVLDSMPSSPGHGEFNPNWHVFVVVPAYSFLTGGNPANDAAISAAYASYLPTTSEAAVDALLAATLGGHPIAVEIDTGFYFICSVVSDHAAK
jgi:hypothetical protein